MTAAAVLVELLKFAALATPEIYEAVLRLVMAFKSQHPALQDPPPVDGEADVDAAIDAKIAKLGE